MLFSLNFSFIYTQNNSNGKNSTFKDNDCINHFLITANSSKCTNNKYDTNTPSSANFYDGKKTDNKIFNVTLDVFSGRPNPNWVLTKEQAFFFIKNISQIKPTTEKIQNYPEKILGYRGFIVDEKTGKDSILKRFEIYNGAIKVVANNTSYILKDKDFQIEKWLVQTAYNHIDNITFNFIKEDIENR